MKAYTAKPLNSTEQVQAFCVAIYEPEDIVELRFIPPSRDDGRRVRQEWVPASKVSELAGLQSYNDGGYDIYVGINPRPHTAASGDDGIQIARCLFADFDRITVDDVMHRIEAAHLPPPSVVVNSGHGVHVYWLLAEPITDLTVWREKQKDLAALLGSDPAICNPERVMRLPGYRNTKEPEADCCLVECDPSRRSEWADLLSRIPKRPAGSNGKANAVPVGDEIPEGERNSTLTSLAGSMRRWGMSQTEITAALLAVNAQRCRPPLPEDEVRAIAASVSRYEAEADEKNPDEKKRKQADILVESALATYRLGLSVDGDAFAVPHNGPKVAIMLRGGRTSLRAALARLYREQTKSCPNASALADAMLALEGIAQDGAPEVLALRVAAHGDGIVSRRRLFLM